MSISNTFPIFEADQVLTNNHLNNLFNYLDQQSRLTRIKLIGSGIVCGLKIKYSASTINVSKGCGLTSQGYIITLCDKEYTHFIPYSAHAYPNALELIAQCSIDDEKNEGGFLFYGEYGESVLQLITQREFDELHADAKATAVILSQVTKSFLDNYSVVLFLDVEEENLKNCDTNDCNDKGSRMDFEVKAMLVDKSLPDIHTSNANDSDLFHHVELKRYNVPVQEIKSADDVLNAFVKLVDNSDTLLTRLSHDLIYCWTHYNYLLKNEHTNPFTDVLVDFKKIRDNIIKNYPILIQYFYDFVDDLIKAFYEFKHKVFDVMGGCCNDELQFPFHLILGEAASDTSNDVKSSYRHYFNYSPLFNSQDEKLNEVRSLFTRMKLLVFEFILNNRHGSEKKDMVNFDNSLVKITPSQYGRSFLSDKSIPYYYKVDEKDNELYRFWNYGKTRRGSAKFILSYHSNMYNTADTIVNPLNYDIEWFNFFRIEGHIGKPVLNALTTIKELQQNYNLPFDVVALSADYLGAILKGKDPKCVIQDLESDYRVLIAEFICRLHNAFCNVGHLKYIQNKNFLFLKAIAVPVNDGVLHRAAAVETGGEDETIDKSDLLLFNIDHPFIATMVEQSHAIKNYEKGDTLKNLCDPSNDTIGGYYLSHVKKGFKNPVSFTDESNQLKLYYQFFDFIDRVETLLATLMNNELSELNVKDVKFQYEKIIDIINSIHRFINQLSGPQFSIFSNSRLNFFENQLLNLFVKNIQLLNQSCFIEQLVALKNEYDRRLSQYRMAQNFNHYFKQHGGIEHKAGVPKGGTFILVYHEERKNRFIDIRSLFVNQELSTLMMTRFQTLLKPEIEADEMEFNTKLMQVATLYRDPELYLRFKDVMTKYLNDCKDLPKAKRKKIKDLIDAPPPKKSFVLKDGMVIADFYVPYICCSDCPPIAYILPGKTEEETEDPTIKIDKNSFCNNDQTGYLIMVTPAGGLISGDGVITNTDGTFVFTPAAVVTPGQVVITYTANGKSVSVTIDVSVTPVAQFSVITTINDGLMIAEFKNESTGINDQTQYTWMIDGNTFSEKRDPEPVNFKIETLPHTILLKESNGQCSSEFSQDINIETENRNFTLCSNIKRFKLEPDLSETDVVQVLSNDGIKMKDATLNLAPSATTITQTTDFHVSYIINGKQVDVTITLIFVNADFMMKLTHNTSHLAIFPTILTLTAKETNAEKYSWKLTVADGRVLPFTGREVEFIYSQFDVFPGSQLTISLTVSTTDQSGTTCENSAEFVLNDTIFNKHMNKDEFDNLTTA